MQIGTIRSRFAREAAPARRASFVGIDEVPCVTAVLKLFPAGARPTVVAYRRRTAWLDHPEQLCSHEVVDALRAGGAREVRVRWRLRVRRLLLA